MRVTLLSSTGNPNDIIAAAAKLCYSSSDIGSLMANMSPEEVDKFQDRLMELGHESPLEHVSFTFGIEGISRACYDKHTQVLTDKGWKHFTDVDINNDMLCSLNDDGDVEYVRAIDKISYDYNGIMDLYMSTQVNLCVTPNHMMWVYDHKKRSKMARMWKFLRSDELVNCRYGFNKSANGTTAKGLDVLEIPSVTRPQHKPFVGHRFTGDNIDLFLELLGIWVTDGYVSYGTIRDGKQKTGNRIAISQIKPFVRDRISFLLDKLGIRYRENAASFRISDQSLFDWLVKNFINGRDTHKTYYLKLPRWMFSDLSVANIRSFLKGVFLGNGSHHVYTHRELIEDDISIFETGSGFNIHTGSENFANDLVELSLLAGLCGNKRFVKPRVRIFPNGRNVVCKRQYVVSILNNGYHMFKTAHNKRHIEYHGKVYCLELEKYHRLYVMRDGKACWCGNCSHQLVRHRIASYSQKSQRYVSEKQFEYVTPPAISELPDSEIYDEYMQQIQKAYDDLCDKLTKMHTERLILTREGTKESVMSKAKKMAQEDARFVLPNACCTSLVMTMNIRSLFNFFKHRMCNRAQWEIRQLAEQMYMLVYRQCPNIFKHAGPSCYTCGKCSEGKMTCGNPIGRSLEIKSTQAVSHLIPNQDSKEDKK